MQCPPEGGYYLHENQCNMFYECTEGRALERRCPGVLQFHQTTPGAGYCDMPRFVRCQEESVEKKESVSVEKDDRVPSDENEVAPSVCPSRGRVYSINGYIPDPYNCTRYYLCIDGEHFHMTCPEPLIYVAKRGYCDWPFKARCLQIPSRLTANTNDNKRQDKESNEDGGRRGDSPFKIVRGETTNEKVTVGLQQVSKCMEDDCL